MGDNASWVVRAYESYYLYPRGSVVRRFGRDAYIAHLRGERADCEWIKVTRPATFAEFADWALWEERQRLGLRLLPPEVARGIGL
ncbi:hypothetical protein [Actinopolyspora halophila]|uniref:hypothetical protein n=1 Tax=Actinopolyspora halophila TaxID=1850 RepID=UPI0012FCAA47|nr:hypothetical protein [Actinopolyspora halophila]